MAECEEWAHVYGKETGCFEVNVMRVPYVVVCSGERVQEVMRHRPCNRQMTAAARSVGADGIFAAEHQQWQHDRRHVVPTFNHNQLRNYLPHFHTVIQRLVDKRKNSSSISSSSNNNNNNNNNDSTTSDAVINRDLFCYALDTNALTTLGKDHGTTTPNTNKNAKDLQIMLEKVMGRVLAPVA